MLIKMINKERYYKIGEEIPIDEDSKHEFKRHRRFTDDNIVPIDKQLHMIKPISRTLNAFLNSGTGGKIYLGIKDNGTITGNTLTKYQRDHDQLCLEELLKLYRPAVPRSWVRMEFVRAIEEERELEIESQELNEKMTLRLRGHSLGRTSCWCAMDANTRIHEEDEYVPRFVTEIVIIPWDPEDVHNAKLVTTKTKLRPIFEDELGNIWMRMLGGNRQYSKEDIFKMTLDDVEDYYKTRVKT